MENILIISGVHGNEHSAIKTGMLLKEYYKKHDNINVIPWVNYIGLLNNKRDVVSYNTSDLNRMFIDGDITKNPYDIIKEAIEKADIVIDIHNSPICANFVLIDKGSKNENKIKYWCSTSNVLYATRYSHGGTIKDYVNLSNKIGITYEFTGMQGHNNDYNIVKAFEDIKKLIDNTNSLTFSKKVKDNMLNELFITKTGVIDFHCSPGVQYIKDYILAEVKDDSNNTIETIKAPCDLRVIALSNTIEMKGSSIINYYSLK